MTVLLAAKTRYSKRCLGPGKYLRGMTHSSEPVSIKYWRLEVRSVMKRRPEREMQALAAVNACRESFPYCEESVGAGRSVGGNREVGIFSPDSRIASGTNRYREKPAGYFGSRHGHERNCRGVPWVWGVRDCEAVVKHVARGRRPAFTEVTSRVVAVRRAMRSSVKCSMWDVATPSFAYLPKSDFPISVTFLQKSLPQDTQCEGHL